MINPYRPGSEGELRAAGQDGRSGAVEPSPREALIGVRRLDFPAVPPSGVRDRLNRLPVQQTGREIAGAVLWLPRVAVSVLAHEQVPRGWLCTLAWADRCQGRLPTGVFIISDTEARTAFPTRCPWDPVAELTAAQYADAWRVRLAARVPGSLMLGEALLTGLDPNTLALTITTAVRAQSGCRTTSGFWQACGRLCDAELLMPLFDDTGGLPAEGRWQYGLRMPASTWPPR